MNSVEKLKVCPECGTNLSPPTLDGFCPTCTARLPFNLFAESSLETKHIARLDFGDYGPHSDVYAVGALLYHLITGTPITAPNLPQRMQKAAKSVAAEFL